MKNNRINEFIKNPRRALFVLAGPLVIGFLGQILYNIADTAFVGRLGNEAIAALTFGFPIFFIFMAISTGISTGVNSRVSRFLGAKKKRAAENTVLHGLLLSICSSIIVVLIGVFSLKSLFSLLGAEGITAVYAYDYMFIIVLSVFIMFPSYVLNSVFSSQGDTKTATIVQISGVVLNIILDPIFIYVFGFGVKGAAIATAISFMFSVLLYLYFIKTRSYLDIHIKHFKFNSRILKDILKVGVPSGSMMFLMSITLMVMNNIMSHFGMDYVAALGIAFRLDSIAMLPNIAVSLAIITLVGMFKGAKRYDLIKDIVFYAIKISVLFMISAIVLLFVFAPFILRIFTDNSLLISLGSGYVRIALFALPFTAVSILISRALQGLGFGLPGLIITLVRMIFVAIPLSYVLVFIFGFGYLSLPLSFVIGSGISSIVAFIFFRHYSRIGFRRDKVN